MSDVPPQTPQTPQPHQPPAPYGYPPPAPPVNLSAILSLVLGVFVFPPLGIYFGGRAKREIARTGERGIELAVAGTVVGWVFTLLWVAMVLFVCAGFGVFGLMAPMR